MVLLSAYYIYFLFTIKQGLNKTVVCDEGGGLPEEFISIIIPFRNESEVILDSLGSIEKQNYEKSKFEVIYVNDSSDDDSLEKLLSAKKQENIRVISVPEDAGGRAHKKKAIMNAINESRGEIILSTDCDCIHSENWIRSMVSMYDSETAFISGPVRFSVDESLFSRFQGLEFAGLILAGAGLIGYGQPVICNAANLSYRKSVYNMAGGFSGNMEISSGDDEFLMRKIAKINKYKIKFAMLKDAVVDTRPNRSFEQFYQQRKRWASKSLFYSDIRLTGKLLLIFLFYLSLPLQAAAGFLISDLFFISLCSGLMAKAVMEYMIMRQGAGIIFNKPLLKYFIPAELLQVPYIIAASIAGVFGDYKWKNRAVKR